MTLFDLLFILVFFGTIATVAAILIAVPRGRMKFVRRASAVLGAGLLAYMMTVAVVAILSPQRVLAAGDSRCFDEMCFTVTDVKTSTAVGIGSHQVRAHGKFYLVTIIVSCRGHGRAQSEGGVGASLIDSRGRVYEQSTEGQRAYDAANDDNPPLTARVAPGDSVSSVQVFDVATDASEVGLHISHSGPGLFIIGDDESPLHKPTIIRLEL